MPTIGFDSALSDAGDRSSGDNHFAMTIAGTYTPSVAEEITEFGFHTHAGAVNFGQIQIGVYRVSTLALIASATVTSATTPGRFTQPITPVAISAGVEYAIGWRTISASVGVAQQGMGVDVGIRNTGLTGTNTLANPFVSAGSPIQTQFSLFATTQTAATNPVLDAENSSFALTVQDATLTWSWGNYYTVEPGTSNTTVGESIFGGLTINAGSRIIGPNSIGGLAATWEISGGNATGRVTLAGGPLTDPVAVSIPYYNGSTWDTISVTFIDEGDVTTSIDAEYASFALTVQDVTLRATRIITAEYASFSYTAQDVTLGQTGWAVSADFAAFVYGAQAVTLTWSGAPVVAPPAGNTEFRGTVTSTILRSTITPWGRDFRNGT